MSERRRAYFALVVEHDSGSLLSVDVEMVLEAGLGDGRIGDVKATAVSVGERLHNRLVEEGQS